MFQENFKNVLRVCQGSPHCVSRVIEREIQGSFKWVPRNTLWCFEEVFRVFEESFSSVSRMFQGIIKGGVQGRLSGIP